jgi:DNA mismatch repair ATPase MutS
MAIEEARLEKQEFDRMKRIEQQLESREKKMREVEKHKREEHARELRLQMEAKQEKVLQEKKDALEEGNIVRKQLHAEAVRLNEIRKEKLGLIIKSGVAEKHCMAFKKLV